MARELKNFALMATVLNNLGNFFKTTYTNWQLLFRLRKDSILYKEEGINVVVEGIYKAGPEEMSAFASRDLDFGYVGEAPATVAVANKLANVKIIAQANLEGSAIVITIDFKR